ncbi:hypothetical protein [Escherichia coli]
MYTLFSFPCSWFSNPKNRNNKFNIAKTDRCHDIIVFELSPIIFNNLLYLDDRILDIINTTKIHINDAIDVIIKPGGYVDHAIALCFINPNDIIVPVITIKIIADIGLFTVSDCFLVKSQVV